MKIKILLTITLLLTIVIYSQQKNDDELKFTDLTLKVQSDKKDFLPFEPIRLKISLSNNTSKDIAGHSVIGFGSDLIRVIITDDADHTFVISNLSPETSCGKISNSTIKTGQKIETEEILYNFNKATSDFGKYKMFLVVKDIDSEQEIQSEKIEINIVEPIGENEKAYKTVKNVFAKNQFLFSGISGNNKRIYDDLANNFPTTLYGAYASYFIGLKYYYKADYLRADEYFNRALDNHLTVFDTDIIKLKKDVDAKLKN